MYIIPMRDRAFLLALLITAPGLLPAVPPLDGPAPADARSRLIAAAEGFLGTPYRYGGLDRRGLDCSGLVYLCFQEALGTAVPRTTLALYRWTEKIPAAGLRRGDLVFFNTAGRVSHVGIYTGEGRFIHAASSGPRTGVMYSRLDEDYWRRTYAGAGRALSPPEDRAGGDKALENLPARAGLRRARFFAGLGLAPVWAAFLEGASPVRGLAAQFRLAAELPFPGRPVLLGLELRPEWDGALGIVRLPLALSLGFNDVIRVFGGPALSLGDPSLRRETGDRPYAGGASWLGILGVQAVPFSFDLPGGALSLYGELCWQSLVPRPGQGEDFNADMAAAFRFSTGLRYTWAL